MNEHRRDEIDDIIADAKRLLDDEPQDPKKNYSEWLYQQGRQTEPAGEESFMAAAEGGAAAPVSRFTTVGWNRRHRRESCMKKRVRSGPTTLISWQWWSGMGYAMRQRYR